jgi:hypothetical protein
LQISGTLHPVRWTIAAALLVPIAVATGALLAKYAGQNDLARTLFRPLRYLFAAEVLLLFIAASIGFVYESRARDRDTKLYCPPGKLVDIGAHRLHISCAGQGSPTVVLEYGHQASYLDWYLVQPEIARFSRVCSYDRAGYGWSDLSPAPRVPSVMAEEMHTLLRAAGEAPPYILVGHSFGSFDAVMFAHKFPNEGGGSCTGGWVASRRGTTILVTRKSLVEGHAIHDAVRASALACLVRRRSIRNKAGDHLPLQCVPGDLPRVVGFPAER